MYFLMLVYVAHHYFMSIATAETPFPVCFHPHDIILIYFILLLLGKVLGMLYIGIAIQFYIYHYLDDLLSHFPHCQISPIHIQSLSLPKIPTIPRSCDLMGISVYGNIGSQSIH